MAKVHQYFGVFNKNELEEVASTEAEAKQIALALSQPDSAGKWKNPIHPRYSIRSVFILETDLNSHFLFGVREMLSEAQDKLRKEEEKIKKMIAEAAKEKTHLPDDYWHRRQQYWLQVESAKRVIEYLEHNASPTKFSSGA